MRELKDHRVNPANDTLDVVALDGPGHGGASHVYYIAHFDLTKNDALCDEAGNQFFGFPYRSVPIVFQSGPISERGVNGVTHEALLAILADRLRGFQSGRYACPENAEALAHIEAAQSVLKSRTAARMARGVEGTHKE